MLRLLTESDLAYRNGTEHGTKTGIWGSMKLLAKDKGSVGARVAKSCVKNWSSEVGSSSPISTLAIGEPPKQWGCGNGKL
jgi:hypothetical protein